MTFSEFGRSWTPNGAGGIDHGTASTALVMGSGVQGRLYGQMPNLGSFMGRPALDVDLRSYYATMLKGWLGGDTVEILGDSYENLGIFDIGPPLLGDADYDGSIGPSDAEAVLEYQLGLRSGLGGCPLTDRGPLTDPASQIT